MEVGSYVHRPIIVAAGRHPVQRGVRALADRNAVHRRRLRPAAGAGARADARAARRREGGHQVRDQRADLDDPRRAPAAGRDARGQGAVVGRGVLDQGGPRLRPRGRRADVRARSRRSTCTRPTRPGSTRSSRPPSTSAPAPARPSTRCTASCTRPSSTSSLRPLRVGPAYGRERALGAVFYETAGWERPFWYASNEPLLEKYAGRLMDRPAEWESRWWSPVVNAEHLAMRDACAPGRPVRVRRPRRDLGPGRARRGAGTRRSRSSTCRSAASSTPRGSTTNGRVPWPTSPSCGSARDRFRVVTGAADGDGRRPVDPRPAAGWRAPRRPDLGLDDDRAVGTPRRATSSPR